MSRARTAGRSRRLPIVVLVATGLLLSATAAPAGVRVEPNYRLGSDTLAGPGRDAPGLAVNPRDPRHLVAVNIEVLGRNCEHRVSRDGGRTWKLGLLRAPKDFPEQPCGRNQRSGDMDASVAFGSGQQVYTAFVAPAGTVDTALVARSTDGGATFAVGVPALAGATYPKVAVQPRAGGDRVYLTSGGSATLVRSEDGGRTWSDPFTAHPAGSASAETTEPVVTPDGTLYLGWRSGTDLLVGASKDAGKTWSSTVAATVPSGGSNFPAIAVDPQGKSVYLVYGRNPPERAPGTIPGTGVGARDHFIPKDSDAMFVRSLDGGRTWGTPLRVNADVVGNGIAQRHPNISVSRTGRIDVVWHDRRHAYRAPQDTHQGNGEARLGDTYLASSFDGGTTFPAERRLTDRSINNDVGLDYKCCSYWAYGPRSIPIGDSEILAAWSDTREGNVDTEAQQIYLSRVRLDASGALPVQRVGGAGDELAVAVSRVGYPAGAEAVLAGTTGFANRPTTEVVIVNPADRGLTLAAAVLARAKLGTVLPAGPRGLSPVVRAEVRRLGPVGAVLIGGERSVPDVVRAQLAADGVPIERVTRISGSSPADTAANVARAMDRRPDIRGGIGVPSIGGTPAFDAAVAINPQAPESAAVAALAASFRLPVLLVSRDAVPVETRAALAFLDVRRTLVIGGTSAISDAVAAQLPGSVRLAGAGAAGTSEATARESVQRGGPANIVYVADAGRPMDAAVLGAAVARAGGLMLLTPRADARVAERQLTRLGLRHRVDRLVVLTQR